MQDQNQTNTTTVTAPIDDTAAPAEPIVDAAPVEQPPADNDDLVSDIASRIIESHNILIALSSDPSVDEMAAAIGLSVCLDRAGHRATAIYSGKTPNALEFLKPDDTFESSADTLQDFVVAINKDKADHLRYKLDGDYVKIFITPYKSRIDEEDLEFSYGDFNIDLVLALNVANGVDLDSALREHGRIMHDATIINITTGNPGKFGEVEWSNKSASSVSEMISRMLLSMPRRITVEADDATAFLTGIVAATNHFSNAKTTPISLEVASELLKAGANRELITENLSDDVDNNYFAPLAINATEKGLGSNDMTSLDIDHSKDDEDLAPAEGNTAEEATPAAESTATENPGLAIPTPPELTEPASPEAPTSSFLGATQPELTPETTPEAAPAVDTTVSPESSAEKPEKIVAPSSDFLTDSEPTSQNKYGQMLEAALAEAEPTAPATVTPIASPEVVNAMLSPNPVIEPSAPATIPTAAAVEPAPSLDANPAVSFAPSVATEPEINGVPEMNFNAMGDILPPPPAPSIDSNLPPMSDIVPAELSGTPTAEPVMPATDLVVEPTPAISVTDTAASNAGAFQIPTAG